jgi:general secretion pathway protein C
MGNGIIQQKLQALLGSSKIAKVVTLLLGLWLVYMLANFSWQVWQALQDKEPLKVPPIAVTESQAKPVNIQQIKAAKLFGDNSAPVTIVEQDELDAPITRLKLTLRGVYSTEEEQLAGAMIEANNEQKVYRVGDRIPGATGLRLHRILADRVILSRSGKYETLMIEDFAGVNKITNNSRQPRPIARPKPRAINTTELAPLGEFDEPTLIDKRNDANISRQIAELRTKLDDPKAIGELISATPVMEDDGFKGFKIAPGTNRVLFGRLGLRRNDLVTGVNGISMTDPQGVYSLMEQLTSADEINLTINRNGREVNILFNAQVQ